jgi:uncharacterized protein
MRLTGDELLLSPTDLTHFLACQHRTWLDLRRARGEIVLDKAPRPDAELIAERGRRHEAEHLQRLVDEGRDVARIGDGATAAAETIDAMRAGRDVIYQAAFAYEGWRGFADFLVRVDEPSALGPWSYEAHDAKLATHPKPYFVFQLLFYTEQVARLQGRPPERMWLVLGTRELRAFRPRDFEAYARRVRERYAAALADYASGALPPYPYPVEHCAYCDWWARCRDRRRADDHLSLVPFLSRAQAVRLEAAGIRTVEALAAVDEGLSVPRVTEATLAGLRQQARLQVRSRGRPVPLRELLPPEAERGFARLPARSPGDVFFDIEGDPYWGEGGLEYLLGTVTRDEPYHALWAHDRAQERASFERWVDWVTARLERCPDLHVYHYNHYEPTALKRLMARHGTREDEVDALLRRQVFVDLYAVVRQAMRIGTESYSLKAVEALYPLDRDAAVTEAGGSILAYQEYVESGDPGRLDAIAEYNRDDCRSTAALRDWLLGEKRAAEAAFGVEIDALAPPPPREVKPEHAARLAELGALEAALEGQLAGDLLQYHRREARPQWWAYFDRLTRTPEELRDHDAEAIGGLVPAGDVPREEDKQSSLHPLRFPPQQHKIGPGKAINPEGEGAVNVARVDDDAGLLWVKRAERFVHLPLPRAIMPPRPFSTHAQQDALVALARQVRDAGMVESAAGDLLARRPPRFAGGVTALDPLTEQVLALDRSALFVQGPPGAGKTYTGARLIAALLRAGRRVGVAATAHKAIHNLLDELEAAAAEEQLAFRGLKKASADNRESFHASAHVESATDVGAFRGDADLLAGTAWLWAREELREAVDVLFVDEAGQVALADALAMAGGARSVVLLGDPQQLAHVSQGTHPRGSGASVLEHLLGDRDTVPPGAGVFLDRTWRMHPDVCRFVSETMYEGRLAPVDACGRQRVDAPSPLAGAGVRLLEVEHADNRQSAPEEAARIAAEVERLLDGGTFADAGGDTRPLTLADILVVAPYNAQVRCLRARLPEGARIGTVDKFQGQQAPVVFFSMTSSSGEDVPRGMDFLFSRNRLNVAVSRAQAVAVVVCSPRLLWAPCATVEQMRLVNALCAFADEAAAQLSRR